MRKMVALDASLIVLLVVGLTKPEYIGKHKRLKTYTVEDFDLLQETIQESAGVVVTPNALSEASNLLRQIDDPIKSEISAVFRAIIQKTQEIYIPSSDASHRPEFIRFGLADNALLEAIKDKMVMVSVDAKLVIAAQTAGYSALNFNHIRML